VNPSGTSQSGLDEKGPPPQVARMLDRCTYCDGKVDPDKDQECPCCGAPHITKEAREES